MSENKRHFDVDKPMLSQIAQSLLETKKMGRSIENAADSLNPLTEDGEVAELLEQMAEHGRTAALIAGNLYKRIAREALAQ